MALMNYPLHPGSAGQIIPHSPQRHQAWELSAWPEKDPECRECTGHNRVIDSHQEIELETKVFGPPHPGKREHANLQRINQRMMHVLAERDLSPDRPREHSPMVVHDSRRRAFGIFQSVKSLSEPREFIYAFDLQQAFEAAEIFGVDEYQIAQLRQKFGLIPGSMINFRTFDAMCDMILAGVIPAEPASPERDAVPPVPGSPEYKPDPKPKVKNAPGPEKNPVPWFKVMDQKMQVPNKVRVIHNFDNIKPDDEKKSRKGKGKKK